MRSVPPRAVAVTAIVLATLAVVAAGVSAASTDDSNVTSHSSSPPVPLSASQRAALDAKRLIPTHAPAPLRDVQKAAPIVTITNASDASAPSLDPSTAAKKLGVTTAAGKQPTAAAGKQPTAAPARIDPHVLDVVRWMLGLDVARQAGLVKTGDRVVSKPQEAKP
jgi:hypothetical protein